MILSYNGPGLIVYGVAYYELDPPYICTYEVYTNNPPAVQNFTEDENYSTFVNLGAVTAGIQEKPCNKTTVCDTTSTDLISYRIDKDDMFYLDNWVEQLDLYCTPGKYIGALGSCAFLGAALACFFLPLFGDMYGRLPVYLVCSLLQLPLYYFANTTSSLAVIYALTFYLGVALIGRFTCGFVLVTECLAKKD